MAYFSKNSLDKLHTCDTRLQKLFMEVIKERDCIIICGHRGKEDQEDAYNRGVSKVHYPNSKHNSEPSMAVDVAPYYSDSPHIHWNDIDDFIAFSNIVKDCANRLEIDIIWGGDFPKIYNTKFTDYPHYEIKE
ncbi:MAG: M15 family peptidase [Bacilli bacterium]|jgi:peptidoglycan L-alanyl-D-glutamate endopeptidase CwlK